MTVREQTLQLGLRPWRWAWLWLAPMLLGLLYWTLAPAGAEVRLATKTWSRDIEVERQVQQLDSGWCDEMPSGAQLISRRQVDRPAGTQPGQAEHCRYSALVWRAVRSLHSEGDATTAPVWPAPPADAMAPEAGARAERLGRRHERYELLLQSADGHAWRCRLPLSQWQALRIGQTLRLRIDRFGVADCGSLGLAAVDAAR